MERARRTKREADPAATALPAVAAAEPGRPGPAQPGRILVVEDHDDVRRLLSLALELEGHSVQQAGTAEEGLGRLRAGPFDLVVSDYALPGRTGAWMLREAFRLGLASQARALLITAHPYPDSPDDVLVLQKPVDLDHFLRQVSEILLALQGQAAAAEPSAGTDRPATPGEAHPTRVELVLYVSPSSAASAQAQASIRAILSRYDPSRVRLTIRDLAKDPRAGNEDRIAFTPTLVKRAPGPRTWVLGDLRQPGVVDELLRFSGLAPLEPS